MAAKFGVRWPVEIPKDCPFTLRNIPFGIFSTESNPTRRAGCAIGTYVLDLSVVGAYGCFAEFLGNKIKQENISFQETFAQSTLNNFAALPAVTRSAVRYRIISLLETEESELFTNSSLNQEALVKQDNATLYLPMSVHGFTDFMCSQTHVDNCTRIAGRPSSLAAFFAMPTAYNGRASSVVVSGTPIHRPKGIVRSPKDGSYSFRACQLMDYELEMGIFVSKPVPFGHRIKTADEAKEHIFGLVLLNDWSARDIQFAEMHPLGPFNGKGSGTSVSPWVVTLDALEAAATPTTSVTAAERMPDLPEHLKHSGTKHTWNVTVEAYLKRSAAKDRVHISRSNLRDLYWSPAQMLSYHASSGCGLRTGDLLGTGTISSPGHAVDNPSLGCLHELTEGGSKPFNLGNGQSLTWLENGDEVIFEGWAGDGGGGKIGFGQLRGKLLTPLE